MNSFDFKGWMAIVTGGAQGIGKAVSEVLAKGGSRIAVWGADHILAWEMAK
ncbi:MAG: hypothetical protein P8M25_16710 [Paracoccaceae bacterium]|nr:hypothetical protein [Paracoccaceae bacterium]